MTIAFMKLSEVDPQLIIDLMNNPRVRRHMPLLEGHFDEKRCAEFIAAKRRLWDEHGYGPWGIFIEGQFAGWGGLQDEDGEIDIALALFPRFWGAGAKICAKFIKIAFAELHAPSITILLPPTRKHYKAILRRGFVEDGERIINGSRYLRYRLYNTGA
jgi:[ribosomal protein S5]-alanine N-acetyltransferase